VCCPSVGSIETTSSIIICGPCLRC
jgi:hypothetical protein